MTALSSSDTGVPTKDSRGVVLTLAGLETRRLLRSPYFLIGLALFAVVAIDMHVHSPEVVLEDAWQNHGVLIAFFLGTFGFVAMNRLTVSTGRSEQVVGTTPVAEPLRTLALCVTCLVPFAIGLVVTTLVLVLRPSDSGFTELFPGAFDGDARLLYAATVALAALGGPLLGVCVGRWWRWPGAGAVTAVLLVVWCVSSVIPSTGTAQVVNYQAAPFHILYTAISEELHLQAWSAWRLPYVAGLCALAGLAAVLHGATGDLRQRLRKALVIVGVVTLGLLVLSVATATPGYVQS